MDANVETNSGATWPAGLDIPPKTELQLSGEDGNVFFIIGRARRAAKRAGWTDAQLEAFQAIVMDGDYDHALITCMEYFDVA